MRPWPILLALLACHAKTPDPVHGAWSIPAEPSEVAPGVYYIGARHIAAYLITTPAGDILIDSGTREMRPQLERNLAQLGRSIGGLEILLCTHAHYDHVQNHAALARASGAKVMVMRADAEALASGVDRSPLAGEGWDPVAVDRILDDNDTVELGGRTLRAIAAPGHTPGCTVWLLDERIIIFGCSRPNDSVQLAGNPRFPRLLEDARASLRKLRALAPELVLLTHPDDARAPFARWPQVLDESSAELEAQAARQAGSGRGAPPAKPPS